MSSKKEIRKGEKALLSMQIFSTLPLSILYSTLVLYITQSLKLDSKAAVAFTGVFIAYNFGLHVLGGYIGGRLLSYRGLFAIGMVLQAMGCFILTGLTFETLITGCSFFLTGCGLNVVCINCMLTQLFDPQDKRRETAFLWNYSGMNLGFLLGFTVSGIYQIEKNFEPLFLIGSVGSLFSLVLALLFFPLLKDRETTYSKSIDKKKRTGKACIVILGLILALLFLLKHAEFSNGIIRIAGIGVLLLFCYFTWKEPAKTREKKLLAFTILAVAFLIFWTVYQTAPMGLTLYFERNVDRNIGGFVIPPQWIQNINSIIIVLGGPTIALINQKLRAKGSRISIPFQFTTALFLIGIGFLLLPLGIYYANEKGFASIGWIIGSYVFQSLGELFISPIGFAMVGQLIPQRLQGFAMGTWMMLMGVAGSFSGLFSKIALGSEKTRNPLITNNSFSKTFLIMAFLTLFTGCILFFLRPFLHRLIQEKDTQKRTEPDA